MLTSAAPKRHRQGEGRVQGHGRRRRTRRAPWYRTLFTTIPASRLAATAAALVVLVGLCFHAGAMGLAHLQAMHAEHAMERWQVRGKVESERSMGDALASIDRAMQLHPDNPYLISLKARALEWRAYSNGGAAKDYLQALTLYREAARLRPIWPDTRAEIINVKLNLGQQDPELDNLVQRAHQLGPYTPAVHNAIVRAELARGNTTSELLQTHLLRGVQDHRSRGQVLQLVESYNQQDAACQLLSQNQDLKYRPRFCQS